MMKQTRWHFYIENGTRYRIKAKYGIDYIFALAHNQEPRFSVTGEIDYKSRNNHWYEHSAGQVTREIADHIPFLTNYLKWHMVGPEGPWGYIGNSKYLWEIATGKKPRGEHVSDPVQAFKHTIVWGGVPLDGAPTVMRRFRGPKEWSPHGPRTLDFMTASWGAVQSWLEARLPDLLAAWVVDMGELGVLEE